MAAITQPRWAVFGQRYGSFVDKEASVAPPVVPPVVPPVTPPGGGGPAISFRRMQELDLENKKRDVDIAVALMVVLSEE